MKRIKAPRLFKAKKLSAATARRASVASAGMDFEGIPEPNMKLSRALLIVLLLHVVAVSGIIAFNAIKTREHAFAPATTAEADNQSGNNAQTTNHTPPDQPGVATAQKESHLEQQSRPAHPPAKEEQTKSLAPSGKTYVVKRGDNPVGIAKKLNVSYNDLISVNHIDDPHKLQIGQKLLVPETSKPKISSGKATGKKKKQNEFSGDKSDGKTHRTPKTLRTKSRDARASSPAGFRWAYTSSRWFDGITPHAS
jgi:LysM repeat protein